MFLLFFRWSHPFSQRFWLCLRNRIPRKTRRGIFVQTAYNQWRTVPQKRAHSGHKVSPHSLKITEKVSFSILVICSTSSDLNDDKSFCKREILFLEKNETFLDFQPLCYFLKLLTMPIISFENQFEIIAISYFLLRQTEQKKKC